MPRARSPLNDASGEVAESHSVSAVVGPEPGEDVGDAESGAFSEHTEGLFDDDPVVECSLYLFGEDFAAAQCALVQDADGRDVGQGLADP